MSKSFRLGSGRWISLAALFVTANGLLAVAHAETLLLGVHPYLPASEIQARFTPLAERFATVLGKPVEVRVGTHYEEHIEHIGRDELDIAFMGPVPYVELVRRYGAKPILARLEINGRPVFNGYIVTRQDSPIRTLADLKGRSFAFGDSNSTMGHTVPYYMLLTNGVQLSDLREHRFLGAHHNVALAVLAGDMDAGALKDEVFEKFKDQGLRAVAVTPWLSEHLFVTQSSMPQASIAALRRVLFELKDTPEGIAVMRGINTKMTGLVPAADSDYDPIREILDTVAHAPK
jgi:phosphonate transport system substrate-binding protein